jgi:hypothetical protein
VTAAIRNAASCSLRSLATLSMERRRLRWRVRQWGPWTCTVLSYDAAKQRVKLSDGWGYTRSFPISQVWLAPAEAGTGRRRLYIALLTAGATAGAVIGSLITVLLLD